jgi:hypothetical protein
MAAARDFANNTGEMPSRVVADLQRLADDDEEARGVCCQCWRTSKSERNASSPKAFACLARVDWAGTCYALLEDRIMTAECGLLQVAARRRRSIMPA